MGQDAEVVRSLICHDLPTSISILVAQFSEIKQLTLLIKKQVNTLYKQLCNHTLLGVHMHAYISVPCLIKVVWMLRMKINKVGSDKWLNGKMSGE